MRKNIILMSIKQRLAIVERFNSLVIPFEKSIFKKQAIEKDFLT